MVDYHYIKRGNKVYGPYYYRSYREGGKVKKEYLGKDYTKNGAEKEPILPFLFLFLFLISISFLMAYYEGITGKVSVDLESTVFLVNEPIAGNLNLILKQGELIPAKTSVVIEVTNETYIKTEQTELKDFVKKSGLNIKKEQGAFYVENIEVSGKGTGYGLKGTKKLYPVVYFKLKIDGILGDGTERIEIVDGSVVIGQNFTHNIDYQASGAEIVDDSVYYYDEKGKKTKLNKDVLDLDAMPDKVVVYTEYFYSVEGFGSDFLSENTNALVLNLSALEIVLGEAGDYTLNVTLSYKETVILHTSTDIEVIHSNLTLNHAPYLQQIIPSQSMHANTNITIDLADYFADADGDALTFSSSQPVSMDISIANSRATLIPQNDWVGSVIITFSASDGEKGNESNLVNVRITNTPPALARDINNIEITKNKDTGVNLSWYFFDEDNDKLIYEAEEPENITVIITADTAVLSPDADFVGKRSITFSASDDINTTASDLVVINVTVMNVNHPPALTGIIPNITMYKNEYASLKLSNYFVDVDGNEITYNASLAEAGSLTISLNSDTGLVEILPDTNFIGNRSIVFSASDFASTTQSNRVDIFVVEMPVEEEEINHIPQLMQDIQDIGINKNGNANINLSQYFSDIDNDTLTFTSTMPENITVSITGEFVILQPDNNFIGMRNITFYVSDGINTTASNLVIINVSETAEAVVPPVEMNHTPILSYIIPDIYMRKNQNRTINLADYFTDEDNDTLVFTSADVDDIDILLISSYVWIIPAENFTGTRNMTFYASDGTNTTASNIVKVDVAINHAPLLAGNIPDIIMNKNANYTINLDNYFADLDGDNLSFGSSHVENISINIPGSKVTLVPDNDFSESRNMTFYASDGTDTVTSNIVGISFENITTILLQHPARIGEPVRWTKKIILEEPTNITIKLPVHLENLSIKKLEIKNGKKEKKNAIASVKGLTAAAIKTAAREQAPRRIEKRTFFTGIVDFFMDIFASLGRYLRVTGLAAGNFTEIPQNFTEEIERLRVAGFEEAEIEISDYSTEYEINYETPAPQATEENITEFKKKVTVSSIVHYTNITSFTSIPEIVPGNRQGAIRLYWVTEETKQVRVKAEPEQEENQTNRSTLFGIPILGGITGFTALENQSTNQTNGINQTSNFTQENQTNQTPENLSEETYILKNITVEVKKPVEFIPLDEDNDGLIDTIEWTVPSLSNQSYEVSITILNVQSYPKLSGNWTVNFTTTGEADLEITAWDGTKWTLSGICGSNNKTCDLKFLELKCGNVSLNYTWLQNSSDGSNNSVFYSNYSCDGYGTEISNVLTGGKHTLRFRFGGDMAYAHNLVQNLECEVSTTCPANYVDMLHMFGTNNSHAELANRSNFDYKVCCNSSVTNETLDYACENNYTNILQLFQETNSHVELNNRSNYDIDLCLSTTSNNYTPSCDYYGSCPTNYTCLASVNQDANSHIGNCSAYPTKICCALLSIPKVEMAINPASPNKTDLLNCSANVTDPSGGVMNVTFDWINQSAGTSYSTIIILNVDSSTTNLSYNLTAAVQAKNEKWNCSVVAFNGHENSSMMSKSVTIVNAPPTIGQVNVTPTSPNTTDTLNCSGVGYDIDSMDTLTMNFTWYNGSDYYNSSTKTTSNGTLTSYTLNDTIQAKNEIWNCTIFVNDGTADSPVNSTNVTVTGNSAPTIGQVDITPSSPNTTDTLNCSGIGYDLDAMDTLTMNFTWYNMSGTTPVYYNSSTKTTSNGTLTSVLLPAGKQAKKEEWNCTIFVNDGTATSGLNSTNVSILNSAPDVPEIGGPENNSRTIGNSQTLRCANSTDADGDTVNYVFYTDTTSVSTTVRQNSTGTTYTLETTDGFRWYWRCKAEDGLGGVSAFTEEKTFLENSLPSVVTLVTPLVNQSLTNRTPQLNWSASTDAEGDSLIYEVNLTCLPSCGADSRLFNSSADTNWTDLDSRLLFFWDDTYFYNWTVRVWDGYEITAWATLRNFTLASSVVLSMVNRTVNFSAMGPYGTKNTSTDSPLPFVIQNDGNCFLDVNMSNDTSAGLLWETQQSASQYFRYKIANLTGEEGAFNWTGSQTSWANVPVSNTTPIDFFNYTDATDTAEIDILIEVPPDEAPGNKNSTLVFTGWYVRET